MLVTLWLSYPAITQELKFPQINNIRYEAKDPHVGGQFVIWVEREKSWYGLDAKYGQDSKIYSATKSVEVTQVTPAPGTTTITIITVISVNSTVPDYFFVWKRALQNLRHDCDFK